MNGSIKMEKILWCKELNKDEIAIQIGGFKKKNHCYKFKCYKIIRRSSHEEYINIIKYVFI
jgi:hypothetical protein